MTTIAVTLTGLTQSFNFTTMKSAGKWLTASAKLESKMRQIDEFDDPDPVHDSDEDMFTNEALVESYRLRFNYGDHNFPVKWLEWVQRHERYLKLPVSPRLMTGEESDPIEVDLE